MNTIGWVFFLASLVFGIGCLGVAGYFKCEADLAKFWRSEAQFWKGKYDEKEVPRFRVRPLDEIMRAGQEQRH